MMLSPFKNLALMNFSKAEDRKLMEAALKSVRSQWGKIYGLRDGRELSAKPSQFQESRNPAFADQVLGTIQMASADDAEQALRHVMEGAPSWRNTPPAKRIQLLEALADWMEANRHEISAWMVYEVGKNWREADADTCEAVDFCRYYAREMNRLSEPKVTQIVQGEHDTLQYFPKGVAVVIAPWNFPFAILAGMTVAALVTGNTVVVKPAEQSMMVAVKLMEGLRAAGFPESSYYFLPGDGEKIGPGLVSDPRVDLIAFTGSAPVGLSILESAAKKPQTGQKRIKKVIAEMGGKNALIIDEDADLDEALTGSVHSAFGFQGQKCSALSRLLVHEKVYDSFIKRFVEATRSLRLGDPANPEYQMGPVIDQDAQSRIQKVIADAEKRLKVLYKGEDKPASGYYVPPAIFEVVDETDYLFQNEIFGPVVAVKKITSVDEGIRLANSVPYALTGGIYSRSPNNIEKAKAQMEVGNLYINRAITGAIVERHPFGGFKLSGTGTKAGGPDYLLNFLEPRTFSENTVRRGFAG